MLGELAQTTDGKWITRPPTRCPNGHQLGPNQVLVGHVACLGHGGGGHMSWKCRTCDAVVYGPRWPSTALRWKGRWRHASQAVAAPGWSCSESRELTERYAACGVPFHQIHRIGVAMGLASGVHHLAISTADIKAQMTFFTDVLGAELKALYWMHGVSGAKHAFVKLNDSSYVAFVHMPAIEDIPTEFSVTHAASPICPSAPGTMQHVAFNVDTLEDLLAMRDRIRSRGINVFGPLNHGLCQSIYFAGPEHLSLEIATSAVPIDDRAWIDPEVVALCGIDHEEMAAMRSPMQYRDEGGRVPNPPIDWSKPHQVRVMPTEAEYITLLSTPDEVVTRTMSEPDPPVHVDDLQTTS